MVMEMNNKGMNHICKEELDLTRFGEMEHIKTTSLWIGKFSVLNPADFGNNKFHTRFHPEIPYQMMLRYTGPGDIVWDCFAGSGTTIDVGRMLGRCVIANDINRYREDIVENDSRYWYPDTGVQLAILHPPYWSMYKYDNDPRNLCNCPSVGDFAEEFRKVVENVRHVLDQGKYAVLVVSDVYRDGMQYPLDFYCYQQFVSRGFILKGRIVKDFGETKGTNKTNPRTARLWRYRALKFGFWELGIDNILVFQKIS